MQSIERIQYIVKLIPAGNVLTYGLVADLAGLPKRARLVSRALKLASPELNLPWHRVINSQGKISLPKNSIAYQQQMEQLRLDGVIVNAGKISLKQYLWKPDMATLVLTLPF
ncbi:MGMT family protein [Shewanella intestini]|uniref:Cysteine methyltransferase n=1 Tax=Shewanella intestini TaxID=2017544 RepID=A0ABS5I003_9GAMM|nr:MULTISPECIES: MGMT family protein [Shewanella]MBR9727251.1 cysteine methyltransferase [Shewanella intestini]MRG36053.1 cysteine methyltransferase [Shewanella sp. XMDDZSB0408]